MKCLLCGTVLHPRLTIRDLLLPGPIEPPLLCDQCRYQFTRIEPSSTCPGCGRQRGDRTLCDDCQFWQDQYGWLLPNYPLFHYHGAMADFLKQYKFHGDYRLRTVFAKPLQAVVSQHLQQLDHGLVVPIPVTTHTMQTRGFNQVVGILSAGQGIKLTPVLKTIQDRKRAQSTKSRRQRLATPQPFALNDGYTVSGKDILLVDDVYTTGRTLYHAAELLTKAGAKRILSVTLAA